MIDLRFNYNDEIINLTVDSNSKIKDVLLQFLERIDAPLDLGNNVNFRYGVKVLNHRRFIEKKVEELLHSGSLINYEKKKPLIYYPGPQHICPY